MPFAKHAVLVHPNEASKRGIVIATLAAFNTFRRSRAVAGFAVLTLAMTGAASLVRAQRETAIDNGESPHSASSPASARRSTEDLAALGKRIFHDTPNEAKPYVGALLASNT